MGQKPTEPHYQPFLCWFKAVSDFWCALMFCALLSFTKLFFFNFRLTLFILRLPPVFSLSTSYCGKIKSWV